MPQLTLFIRTGCAYCHKVLSYLDKNKITVPLLKNISDGQSNADELIKIGGKRQVPCLIIDGKSMYESDDIIKWFEKNYLKQ